MLQPGEMIVYAEHTRDRMALRGIAEEDVRATLEEPDRERKALPRPPAPPSVIYLKRIGGRICKVYVQAESSPVRVVTVAWHGEGSRRRGDAP